MAVHNRSYDLVANSITNEFLRVIGRLSAPTRDQIITAFAVIGIEYKKRNVQASTHLSESRKDDLINIAVRVLCLDTVFPEFGPSKKWDVVCLKWLMCIADPRIAFKKVVSNMKTVLSEIVDVTCIGVLARRRTFSVFLNTLKIPSSSIKHMDGSDCIGSDCSCIDTLSACVCAYPSFREINGMFVCSNSSCMRTCPCSPGEFDSWKMECSRCGVKYISGP